MIRSLRSVQKYSLFFLIVFIPVFVGPVQFSPTQYQKPKKIALTFDDGPRPASTLRLRKLLRQHGIPATFFIVGKIANRYPDVVRALAQDGHEIASHTWSHPNVHKISKDKLMIELRKTRNLIRKLTGSDTNLFRTPGSTRHFLKKKFVVPDDYQLILWDAHSQDHAGLSSEEIYHRLLKQVKDGDIVLLHNGLNSTLEALDCLIPKLKTDGFEFVTVSELKGLTRPVVKEKPQQKIIHG